MKNKKVAEKISKMTPEEKKFTLEDIIKAFHKVERKQEIDLSKTWNLIKEELQNL